MSEQPPAGVALRWSRAAVLTVAALGFAAVAHATSGGQLPGPVAMTVLAGLTVALLASLLGRQASTARVVALLVTGQAALHAVFTALGGHAATATAHATGGEVARVAVPDGTLASSLGADQLATRMSAGPSPIRVWVHHLVDDLSSAANVRMALAHLVAAAGLGLWLASGERLAWRLVALLTGPASAIVSRVAATVLGGLAAMAALAARTTRVRVPPPATDPPRPALLLLARAVDRRGPPTFSI